MLRDGSYAPSRHHLTVVQPLGLDCGLPLGGYLSHWSGGLHLNGLDHFIKRELKISASMRYMDDIVLFHDDEMALSEAEEAIREWLLQERRLTVKPRREPIRPTSEACTYLGFRVSRAGANLGPKAKRRLKRKLLNTESTRHDHLVRSLRSYRGLLLSLG